MKTKTDYKSSSVVITGDPDPLRRIARAHIAKEASEREPRAELERESVISLLIFFRRPYPENIAQD
jgi:hypothetical protein